MQNKIVPATRPSTHLTVKSGIIRPIEALAALVSLIILSPLIALSALAIVISSRGSVLFRQQRVGRHGHGFVMYKLRTMRASQTGPQVTAGDDSRVTLVGRFLRKAKLDELPELWNVLKGDMSLVGPRPEVPRYVNLNDPAWQSVLAARPGLTDPMTLRLRNEEMLLTEVKGDREVFYRETLLPYKLKGYLGYLEARNWRSDVKVLYKTAIAVLFPDTTPPPTLVEISRSMQEFANVSIKTEARN